MVSFAEVGSAVEAAGRWAAEVPGCSAVELFMRNGLELVCAHRDLHDPFGGNGEAVVLVEAAGADDPTGGLASVVGATLGIGEVLVGSTPTERSRLWAYREGHTEAINSLAATQGPPHKLDVTLPHRNLGTFITSVPAVVASVAPQAHTWLFGHAGDGNIHVNVTGLESGDLAVDDAVLSLVASLGGSISAEHGIGVAKMPWLALGRSPAERAAFRSIKRALDPDNIMNPGVLVDS